jgi:hypothetical protein
MKSAFVALIAFAAAVAAIPAAGAPRQIIGGEQDHSLAAAGDCENFYATTFTSFGSHVQDKQQREITLAGAAQLRIEASQEGGISIRGWNRSSARLVICRNAVANGENEARSLLQTIQISTRNGVISAQGPPLDHNRVWWANMILYVPRRASIEVRGSNGGVAIRNMSGRVTAQTTSGGISVAQSTGKYTVITESGGITLDRVNGLVDAASRDGSIALKLAGAEVPSIEAKTAEPGQIVCSLESCEEGKASWTPARTTLRIGSGIPDIRLATGAASIFIAHVSY